MSGLRTLVEGVRQTQCGPERLEAVPGAHWLPTQAPAQEAPYMRFSHSSTSLRV